MARDITERMRAEEELARMAHYDALTGLPNRALLQGRLTRAMARADRGQTLLAVMFLDLDQFKEINDSLGHAVGDAVLKEIALRLESGLRATDTVARLGGDEFTILLEDVRSAEEISRIAEKLLRAISERADVAGHELHLSTSIGVTVYPLDGRDADTLLRNADLAMYHAKQEGRNNVQFFSRDMSERTEKRVDLLGRLRGAIARNELQLHYQPQVDVRSGGIIGVEALLRWNDPRARPGAADAIHPARRGHRPDRRRSANGCCARPAARRSAGWTRASARSPWRSTSRRASSARRTWCSMVAAILAETGAAAACFWSWKSPRAP